MSRLGNDFVSAAGLRTGYVHAGSGHKTAVLLHGGTPGADGLGYWGHCLPLIGEEARAIALDLPGFGRTDKPDPDTMAYSQPMRVAHIVSAIEALGLSEVTLVGTSLGGAAALGVCMERPELVSGLVLVASAGLSNPSVSRAAAEVRDYDGSFEALRRLLEFFVDARFEMPRDLLDYVHRLSLDEAHRKALKATSLWAREHNMLAYPEEKICVIRTPTLVVNGKSDRATPLALAYRFLGLIENSWGWIIPNCGHLPMIERPQELSRAILNFLGSI